MTIQSLQNQLKRFAAERGWERHHTPANLAAAISVEAGELQQHFLWNNQFSNPYRADEVALELADIMIYCLNCYNAIGRDAEASILEKIRLNADRWPTATP